MLSVGSCFSGIGGLELGLEWTGGFETKWQIEKDEYASRVLAKHWPGVKRYSDICSVDGRSAERVDVICGGFPCQDVSVAGTRAGLEGKRSTLWSEMYRLVCEVRPKWVVAENVPGLLSSDGGRFFGNILRDLADAGYDAKWGVLSAAGVGAPHLRRRIFILANANSSGGRGANRDAIHQNGTTSETGPEGIQKNAYRKNGSSISDDRTTGENVAHSNDRGWWECRSLEEKRGSLDKAIRKESALRIRPSCSDVPDSAGLRRSEGDSHARRGKERARAPRKWRGSPNASWWEVEPNVGRVAHGVPSRVDRLRCLGNAVVPQVAQKIGEMILGYR